MGEIIATVILLSAGLVTFRVWRSTKVRRETRIRLGIPANVAPLENELSAATVVPFVRPHLWIPYLLGLVIGLAAHFLVGIQPSFSLAVGMMTALFGAQIEQFRVDRKIALIEAQLADALDLMISALSAGTGVFQALEVAARESRAPLKPQIENMVQRIRYGDDPQTVLQTLEGTVPLQTFRLFSAALSVHWEVGGSLTGPLAIVARTIRDRVELGRRVRSLTMQSRASTFAVMGTTYFIALIMWRTDPERMASFLGTTLGQWLVSFALILQVVGVAWTARLSRMQL